MEAMIIQHRLLTLKTENPETWFHNCKRQMEHELKKTYLFRKKEDAVVIAREFATLRMGNWVFGDGTCFYYTRLLILFLI